MASGQTSNYGLNQWAAEDKVLRTDFNQDNAKLDAALEGLREAVGTPLQIVYGTYTGTGAVSHTVAVGFRAKLVLIFRMDGIAQRLMMLGGSAEFQDENGQVGRQITGSNYTVSPNEQGLYLSCTYSWDNTQRAIAVCNASGVTYAWLALG